MSHITVSFQTITTLFLLIAFPTHKKIGSFMVFGNFCSDKHIFSSYAKSCFLSLKMWKSTTPLQVTSWNIQNAALKKDMLHPFLKLHLTWEWTYIETSKFTTILTNNWKFTRQVTSRGVQMIKRWKKWCQY